MFYTYCINYYKLTLPAILTYIVYTAYQSGYEHAQVSPAELMCLKAELTVSADKKFRTS